MATVPGAGTDRGVLPEEAYAVALASVPGVGPRTLRALLCEATPRNAWDALLSGRARLPSSLEPTSTRHAARGIDVAALWSLSLIH
ncbi:MAG: hypothetical protein ACRDXC_13035, partial [Acidimicrobiales bacterium]